MYFLWNFHSREAIDIGVVRSFLQPTFLPWGGSIMSIWAKYSLCIPSIILAQEYEGKLKAAPYKWCAIPEPPSWSRNLDFVTQITEARFLDPQVSSNVQLNWIHLKIVHDKAIQGSRWKHLFPMFWQLFGPPRAQKPRAQKMKCKLNVDELKKCLIKGIFLSGPFSERHIYQAEQKQYPKCGPFQTLRFQGSKKWWVIPDSLFEKHHS